MSVTPHSSQNKCYCLTMYTIVDMSLTVFFSSSYDRCICHENKLEIKMLKFTLVCLLLIDHV
jgi:hypothetical protein